MFRLLLITDRTLAPGGLPAALAPALAGVPPGTVAVQLREKDLGARELGELARALLPMCRAHGVRLLINDRVDLALALDLDGVHLPQRSFPAAEARALLGPSRFIGVSCHSAGEVAAARGADYATFGPLFATPSKEAYGPPLGLAALKEATPLGVLLVGLGGIDAENAGSVCAAGAAGVAVVRAWLSAEDPAAAVAALLRQ